MASSWVYRHWRDYGNALRFVLWSIYIYFLITSGKKGFPLSYTVDEVNISCEQRLSFRKRERGGGGLCATFWHVLTRSGFTSLPFVLYLHILSSSLLCSFFRRVLSRVVLFSSMEAETGISEEYFIHCTPNDDYSSSLALLFSRYVEWELCWENFYWILSGITQVPRDLEFNFHHEYFYCCFFPLYLRGGFFYCGSSLQAWGLSIVSPTLDSVSLLFIYQINPSSERERWRMWRKAKARGEVGVGPVRRHEGFA